MTRIDMPGVSQRDILDGLRSLGVGTGDVLAVHNSLSRFGHVDGGADAVARALLESVGPSGTVFVPTFNYGQLPFDPETTPSLAGAISESLRRWPDALRSRHPTHPWAGIGPAAAEVLAGHEHATPFGPRSPIWRLWERDARVLLLGVDHPTNSMIHVAEERLGLAYLDRTRVAKVVCPDGSIEEVVVRRPGHSGGFGRIDATLRRGGRVRETAIGNAHVMMVGAADVVDAATQLLTAAAAALLCDDAACERCAEARSMLANAKPPR